MQLCRRSLVTIGLLLLWAATLFGQASVRELTILHFNDLHAHLVPDADHLGGFAHIATLLKRERAAAKASLTLNAGDLVQGTPVSTLFQGVPVFEVANLLGIDVNCLGNHEFDYGWGKIPDFMKVAKYPTVSGNVVDASGKRLADQGYVVRDAGGMRVAVVGAMLETLADKTTLANLGPWHAAPIVKTLAPIVADAKQHADMVVVLGHLERSDIEAILNGLPDVAVVVAGHVHSGLPKLEVGGRIGVHPAGYGREVGRLRLRYDTATRRIVSHDWTRIPVDTGKYPADPEVQKVVQQWESKVAQIADVPIGRATRRMNQTELRALMERAMLDRIREKTQVDFAYTNLGGVRDILPQGQILTRNVWNIMPFDNRVVVVEVPADQLVTLMDPGRQDRVAERVRLDPKRTYRMVTTDFLSQSWADRGRKFRVSDQGVLLRDLLVDWIKQKKVVP
jgi:2',3'-cyclic-nucleotide 2'-phosphodiesterase (5'-nucleotidase family)